MCKFKNSYVSLKDYNKFSPEQIQVSNEKYIDSNYTTQKVSYPYQIDNRTPWLLTNYSSSGVVATNPSVYSVAIENPGLSWI